MRASGTNFLGRCSDARDHVAPPQSMRLTLYFTFPFASLTIDGEVICLDLLKNLNDIQTLFFFSFGARRDKSSGRLSRCEILAASQTDLCSNHESACSEKRPLRSAGYGRIPPVRLNLSGLTGSRVFLSINFVAVKFQTTSFDAGF